MTHFLRHPEVYRRKVEEFLAEKCGFASDAALTLIPALPIAPPLGRDGNCYNIALVQLFYAALVHCPYLEDAVILPPGCVSMLVILSCPADLAAVIEVGGPWEGAVTWALTRTPIWWLKPRASRVSGNRRLTCSGPVSGQTQLVRWRLCLSCG